MSFDIICNLFFISKSVFTPFSLFRPEWFIAWECLGLETYPYLLVNPIMKLIKQFHYCLIASHIY